MERQSKWERWIEGVGRVALLGDSGLRSLTMFSTLATAVAPVLADGPYIYWGGGGLGLIVVIVVIVLLLRR